MAGTKVKKTVGKKIRDGIIWTIVSLTVLGAIILAGHAIWKRYNTTGDPTYQVEINEKPYYKGEVNAPEGSKNPNSEYVEPSQRPNPAGEVNTNGEKKPPQNFDKKPNPNDTIVQEPPVEDPDAPEDGELEEEVVIGQ